MYSRKLGVSSEQTSKSLESFNERLREQYTQKINASVQISTSPSEDTRPHQSKGALEEFIDNATNALSGLSINLDFDNILILGIIILILTDANPPDLVLIGILASLIF